jgi:hypothetical protein
LWTPGSSRLLSLPADCETEILGDVWDHLTFAAAPGLIAWANCAVTMSVHCRLLAGMPGRRASNLLQADADLVTEPGVGLQVFSDGSLVVADLHRVGRQTELYRVVPGRTPVLKRLRSLPVDGNIVAMDAGRLLIRQGYQDDQTNPTFIVDALTGATRSLPLGLARDDVVRLAGDRIAVQRDGGSQLEVYDARTGRLRVAAPLGGPPGPYLAAIRGNLVAYTTADSLVASTTGRVLHILRLGGGDQIVSLPGMIAPVTAAFSPRGLFVSYAIGSTASRLLLLPLAALAR